MKLIETVFMQLKDGALLKTAEEFSTDWCWRSKSWFAVQKSKGSDLSIQVAINLLNKVKIKAALAQLKRKKLGGIVDDDIAVLHGIRDQLERYLLDQHRIAEVSDAPCEHAEVER